MEDQRAFADFSGDWNPMHMDPAAARRTQAGACAVHGVHATLWALDAGLPYGAIAHRVRATFKRFVRLDAPVELVRSAGQTGSISLRCIQDETEVVILDVWLGEALPKVAGELDAIVDPPSVPSDREIEQMESLKGVLPVPRGAQEFATAQYPRLTGAIGANRVCAIAVLSALVGMHVPGLHSIFSALEFDLGDDAGPMEYAVTRVDPRFRLVEAEVRGSGVLASVRAFVRMPPTAPPKAADLARRVPKGAFSDRRALVIGGSRGLGATTALLLAAGGASVTLTFRSGFSEAKGVVDDIKQAGFGGRAEACQYDSLESAREQLACVGTPPNYLYYFATGKIDAGLSLALDRKRLSSYLDVYVEGFSNVVDGCLSLAGRNPLRCLYPSTVFIDSTPSGMAEYAMAKAAGEVMCAAMMRQRRNLSIDTPRLPRTLTDQTATVPPVPAADPVDVMLPILLAQTNPSKGSA